MSWLEDGYQIFEPEQVVLDWLEHARPAALASVNDPQIRAEWLRCGGTWFVGVDALPNDMIGRVGDSGPLDGSAMQAVRALFGDLPLHKGQVSVTYPGYPQPWDGENEAALRFRRNRDAAHLDGLKPIGPERRRMLDEPHAWIIGLPLSQCGEGASPLVIWRGSHKVIRAHLEPELARHAPEDRARVDLTEIYQAARREVFETCERIEVPGRPGEVHLLHRMTIHGVAPWADGATAPPEGRAVLYFRPEVARVEDWLTMP